MYIVTADAPHLTGTAIAIDLFDSQLTSEQLDLMLALCDASLHGTVYDNASGTIAGAVVTRYDERRLLSSTSGTISDDHGEYELCVSAAATWYEVRADCYASVFEEVGAYGKTTHDFTLNPGATIVGHVVRASDHQPVAGAVVTLHSLTQRSASYATSGVDGKFTFEGLIAGRQVLTAKSDGLATRHQLNPVASVGAPSEDIICELEPTVSIAGTIVDHTTKVPQPEVELSMVTLDQLGPQRFTGRSRSDGTFVIEVPTGDYLPTLEEGIFLNARPIHLQARENLRGVVLEIDAGGSIAGHVTRGGKPLAGARVTAASGLIGHEHTVMAGADGSYLFTSLEPTDYDVSARADRIGESAKPHAVKLGAGERKSLDFDLDLAASVSGVVVDQNDQPIRGAIVRFTLLHGHDDGSSTTSDDGRFRVDGMSGGGQYAVQVQRSKDGETVFQPATGDRVPTVALLDGTSSVTGLRIVVNVDQLVVSGRVVDESGKPVSDIMVTAGAEEYRPSPFRATSDQAGAFTIRDLRAGSYFISTDALGGSESARVQAGTTDVIIRIATPGVIEGTLEGFGERPEVVIVGATFSTNRTVHAEVAGSMFRQRAMAPGKYTITAASQTDYATATVDVGGGAVVKVTVRSSGRGSIVGSLTDGNHKPIADAFCTAVPSLQGAISPVDGPSARTDVSGSFRIDHAPAVDSQLTCYGQREERAEIALAVVKDQATRADLIAGKAAPRVRGTAGLELEQVFTDVFVSSVTPGGPGDRAGVQVGDLVVTLDDAQVANFGGWIVRGLFTYAPAGTVVKVGVLRGDKTLQLSVTLAPI